MIRRRRVRCWFCGHTDRRVRSVAGIPRAMLDVWRCAPGGGPLSGDFVLAGDGKVGVVGRKRSVVPYGVCGADLGYGRRCDNPMLLTRDARYVLRAALEWDRRGNNRVSEFD